MAVRKTSVFVSIGVAGTIISIALAALFQPWKLFIDTEVQEEIPLVQPTPRNTPESTELKPTPTESSEPTPGETKPSPKPTPTKSSPIVLAEGALISHEHKTSGTVKILQLADGSRILRLENLSTSDGPRVEVWMTDAPVIEGGAGWFVFDDGRYESLGAIKGNKGNQNYEIPADLDLGEFSSVSLWCATFAVSFGAAELDVLES